MKCPNNLEKECTCRWVCNNINNKSMKNLHITPEIEEAIEKMISMTMWFMVHQVSEEEFKHYKTQLYNVIDNEIQAVGAGAMYR